MKTKLFFLSFCFILISSIGFSQKKKQPKSIISDDVAIKKYHSKDELDRMAKGELLVLYEERIESLVKLMPYIAFATKPGVTMSTLGIPNDSDNRKALDDQFEATDEFIEKTSEFQKRILPYSDTNDLVSAIIFYEETLKSLHEYSEFH
ncbi:hypothetical protein [Hyunsoonleella ulvae]|uniref:hypothetical protein n=1 Tax=Hyunsoonleella ulvae TaxID=2799948 RepID=UPI00193A6CAF|nr:hypothetical protein [Hyunsoonleella ulvae]